MAADPTRSARMSRECVVCLVDDSSFSVPVPYKVRWQVAGREE